MNYERAWSFQREVSARLYQRLLRVERAAAAVLQMECERVNSAGEEPYDPIANPGQFDQRIVDLAWAIEPDVEEGKFWSEENV